MVQLLNSFSNIWREPTAFKINWAKKRWKLLRESNAPAFVDTAPVNVLVSLCSEAAQCMSPSPLTGVRPTWLEYAQYPEQKGDIWQKRSAFGLEGIAQQFRTVYIWNKPGWNLQAAVSCCSSQCAVNFVVTSAVLSSLAECSDIKHKPKSALGKNKAELA